VEVHRARPGAEKNPSTNIELGNNAAPQLYNLKTDVGEKKNLAAENPKKVEELKALLAKAQAAGSGLIAHGTHGNRDAGRARRRELPTSVNSVLSS
jgi:hypothetical protein